MSAPGADPLAAIRQRAENAKEIGAVSVAWSQDIPFLLKQWDDRESALRALVAQWKQEAVDGLTAGEPDAFERAQVWAECSEELERLLSGPQP